MGHDCHGPQKANQQLVTKKRNVEDKEGNDKQVWMPIEIAKIIQGVTNLSQLRQKLDDPQLVESAQDDHPTAIDTDVIRGLTVDNSNHLTEQDTIVVHTNNQSVQAAIEQAGNQGRNTHKEYSVQVDEAEDGWTPVAPAKAARRGSKINGSSSTNVRGQQLQAAVIEQLGEHSQHEEDNTSGVSKDQIRDGNPQIPSPQ
ncbi:unnamed protein product [Amaranthus hypochondriacus]